MSEKHIENHPLKWEKPRLVLKTFDELETALQKYKYYAGFKTYNFDLSALDFSTPKGQEILSQINEYDDQTVWPDDLKDKMAQQLETGKYAGLGMHELLAAGIDGSEVHIAIIDNRLLIEHPEIKENIESYHEVGYSENPHNYSKRSSYHGPATASLTVGDNCGTAPKARLHFWACAPFGNRETQQYDSKYRCQALKEIIAYNNASERTEKDKIRCVSCSWGNSNDIGFEETQKLFKQLEESGCMVVGGGYNCMQGFVSCGLDRDLTQDLDNPNSYQPLLPNFTRLCVPEHKRTFAAPTGGYTYCNIGGSSWTLPYITGLVACAIQADPNLVQQKDWQRTLWQTLFKTGITKPNNKAIIVQPKAFIKDVLQQKKEREIQTHLLAKTMGIERR